jgi:hypothetical protein
MANDKSRILPREWCMKSLRILLSLLVALLLALPAVVCAQSSDEGKVSGNYNIHQTLELGWQQTSRDGNQGTYGTFVNLNDGFRVFEHTLQMRSLNHQGTWFDNLFASSFGYGGDPNNATRLRISKNKWYNFNASFRRDYQRWDYDLWANPLNAPNTCVSGTTNCPNGINIAFPADTAINFSPHTLDTVRRNSDFNLTIAPQSRLPLRLGYNRLVWEGPTLSSIHGLVDALLFQKVRGIQDTYQIGFDVRAIPRTVISYTQYLQNYKQDYTVIDQNLAQVFGFNTPFARTLYFPLAAIDPVTGTTQVDIGLPPNTSAFTTTAPQRANPNANSYTFYGSGSIDPVTGVLINPGPRTNPTTNFFPTENLSLQSSYFKNLDFVAHFAYSNSQVDSFWNEQGIGRGRGPTSPTASGTRKGTDELTGPGANNRVAVNGDAAITWRIADRILVSDNFRYNTFRLPGFFDSTETAYVGLTNSLNSALNLASPIVIAQVIGGELDYVIKTNLVDVAVDLTRHLGGHIGYRYTDRASTHKHIGPDPETGEIEVLEIFSVPLHEHGGVLGLWARPRSDLRLNFDLELSTSSNACESTDPNCALGQATITRLSPNHLQHYNFRTRWTPRSWLALNGSVNILETRNNQLDSTDPNFANLPINLQHNRNFGFGASISKSSNWALDFGYNYNAVFSRTSMCFDASPLVSGVTLIPGGCPPDMQSQGQAYRTPSTFEDLTHDFFVNASIKPVKRVSFSAGYDVLSVSGTGLLLGAYTAPVTSATVPLSSLGPQDYTYHRPSLGMAVELSKELTWKTNWRYYDYSENAQSGPTLPRGFTGHVVDLALRYAF